MANFPTAEDLYRFIRQRHPNVPVANNYKFQDATRDSLLSLLNLDFSSLSDIQSNKLKNYLAYFCSYVPRVMKAGRFSNKTFKKNFFRKKISLDEAPVEAEAPVVDAEAPVIEAEAPVVDAEAPVVDAEAPVVDAEALVVDAEAPVVDTEAPVVDTEAPVVDSEGPSNDGPSPSKKRKSFDEKSRWQQHRDAAEMAVKNESGLLILAAIKRLESEGKTDEAFNLKYLHGHADAKGVNKRVKEFLLNGDFDDVAEEKISPIRCKNILLFRKSLTNLIIITPKTYPKYIQKYIHTKIPSNKNHITKFTPKIHTIHTNTSNLHSNYISITVKINSIQITIQSFSI